MQDSKVLLRLRSFLYCVLHSSPLSNCFRAKQTNHSAFSDSEASGRFIDAAAAAAAAAAALMKVLCCWTCERVTSAAR